MSLQTDLLEWYDINKRPLVFREHKDPYAIWVSEIMAQQTRIEAMLPYFERFVETYPDIVSLSEADDEKLNHLWQGLGYYSRVRNMKKAAIVCVNEYDGKMPDNKKDLEKLPGIGSYTAGAIASIAFDENVSAVDGNVIRVFSRLYNITEDVKKTAVKKQIESLVDASLPGSEYISDYNQALMELGALICIPKNPRCEICPVKEYCVSLKEGDPASLPIMKQSKARRIEHKTLYIQVHGNKIRLIKRPDTGLLAGLYGFDQTEPNHIIKSIELKPYTHIFSHVEWHMKGYLVWVDTEDESFYSMDEIEETIAIPTAFQPFYKQTKEIIERTTL